LERQAGNFDQVEKAMSLTMTEKAAAEVKRTIQDQNMPTGAMLRIAVVSGGCSGLNYSLQIDDKFDEVNDSKSEQFGVTVVVDRKSELFLDGTTLDYYEGIDQRGFHFSNPNAKRTCGCGNSFHV
jgi:iron-sulfur cluster assembly protein